jgi:hypothetical protein
MDSVGPQTALQSVALRLDRYAPLENREALYFVVGGGTKQQDLGLTPAQFPHPTSANRAAVILRRCAMSLGKTSTALGAFYRRMAVRIGKSKAITATVRELAVLVYRVLSGTLIILPGLTFKPAATRAAANVAVRVANHFLLVRRISRGILKGRLARTNPTLICPRWARIIGSDDRSSNTRGRC